LFLSDWPLASDCKERQRPPSSPLNDWLNERKAIVGGDSLS